MSRTAMAFLVAILALALSSGGCSGCGAREDDGTAPSSRELPAIELRDDTPSLLLTWVDDKGDHHVVQRPADVPAASRDAVRVVIAREGFEGDGDMVYVADLRNKLADGGYAVRSMPRSEWELIAQQRRDKTMAAAAPPAISARDPGGGPSPTVSPTARVVAIVYGATWCEACRGAIRHLRRRGVDVIEKDIESSDQVRQEMQEKLAAAHVRDKGTIPVIDVRGEILVGFDEREIDRAIKKAARGEAM